MKYEKNIIDVSIPKKNLLKVLTSNEQTEEKTEEDMILNALKNPIGTKPLKDIVKAKEKICIIISDITRAWQKMNVFLPYILEELYKGGVDEKDITFLCATGSHRKQTNQEHRILLGDLLDKFEVIDHDCYDQKNLVYLGETSFHNPVYIHKKAIESDHVILTGAIIFHDLAGWGGGRKSILPGISGYETIMFNHALALNPNIGDGINEEVRCGNIDKNPIHLDMMEACHMVKPSFLFNVVINEKGNIAHAVAGHYDQAHEVGTKIVDEFDGVLIQEKADVVIASAGGYPKDINLYQASKALSNMKECVKVGGYIVLLAQCTEGIGNEDMRQIIEDYENNIQRERALRKDFTVSKYIAYMIAEMAQKYKIILVSEMDSKVMQRIGIIVVKEIREALDQIKMKKSPKIYLAPQGANILPRIKEK